MGAYRLRRFSRPEVLKALRPEALWALLRRYGKYFGERGIAVDSNTIDCDLVAAVLMEPDSKTPHDLIQALYEMDGLATPAGMDDLMEVAQEDPRLRELVIADDPSPAEVALEVWLLAPDLLDEVLVGHMLAARRSFEHFPAKGPTGEPFKPPSTDRITKLENTLNDYFQKLRRGRHAKVQVFPDGDGSAAFLIRHGDVFRREGAVDAGGDSVVAYRPEKFDVLRYDGELDELAVNAENQRFKEIYRTCIGRYLFGDAELFSGNGRYTLSPLRDDARAALACDDIEGLDSVVLTELRFDWGGAHGEKETRQARDLLAAFESRKRSIPTDPHPRIVSATFAVRFTGSQAKRKVTIRPPSVANYTRDTDAELIGKWLVARGFVSGRGGS